MPKTTERNWTEPIGELSMAWAEEMAKQFPTETNIIAYTPLDLPPDRHGAQVSFTLIREKDNRVVNICVYVKALVKDWDASPFAQRVIEVQVYSPTGGGTGGVTTTRGITAADGSAELAGDLRVMGEWAWAKRLEVAD